MPTIKWCDDVKPPPPAKPAEEYQPLNPNPENIDETPTHSAKPSRQWCSSFHILTILLTAITFAALGFILGHETVQTPQPRASLEGIPPPSGDVPLIMHYNTTFSAAPSPESDGAWDALFPPMKGFITSPSPSSSSSAPSEGPQNGTVVGISLFHQLHCVNILRLGLYFALSHPTNPNPANGTTHPHPLTLEELNDLVQIQHIHDHNRRPGSHHLRHCFDYLRQSLMCVADTNLEDVNLGLGGVTGWGKKRCRDFEEVKRVGERLGA